MKKTITIGILGMSLLTSLAIAHGPHEHGVARMNVIVDGANVEIALESPLANALSFEHSPTSDAQRAEVQAMAAKLRQAEEIFLLTKAAQCHPAGISLVSENLPPELLGEISQETYMNKHDHTAKAHETSVTETHKEPGGHGDLDASFTFKCAKPEVLKDIDVLLFKVWPALHELEVQLVTPLGQKGAELTSEKHKLVW